MLNINYCDIPSNLEKLELLISQLDPSVYEKLLYNTDDNGMSFASRNGLFKTGLYIRNRISLIAKFIKYTNIDYLSHESFNITQTIEELDTYLLNTK
ncbi:hypothetical protein [Breznakia pachnodae]|uniref:Uncharacterized protein n=1 Tax=Breznakia pachnodae TaxID=265178 RepID=A0ABU0DZE0_9FIRM|nr:hypothetical protein [Breznakia pachnodae]MDQ0360003.1 hypothetical protein [Breznakia pachnodae]